MNRIIQGQSLMVIKDSRRFFEADKVLEGVGSRFRVVPLEDNISIYHKSFGVNRFFSILTKTPPI